MYHTIQEYAEEYAKERVEENTEKLTKKYEKIISELQHEVAELKKAQSHTSYPVGN